MDDWEGMEASDPLASYLSDLKKTPSKCHACNDTQAREYLQRLCEMKEQEDPSVTGMSFKRFHEEFLVGKLGLTLSIHSCLRHVKECLKRDSITGKPR